MLFKSTLCKSRENLPTDSNADKVAYKNTTNTDENSYVRTTKEQSGEKHLDNSLALSTARVRDGPQQKTELDKK